MRVDVPLPDLGEESTEAVTISEWLAKIGQPVQVGDDLVELTTDKAAFSLPAPQAGVLAEIRVQAGETVQVGSVLCVLDV